MMFIVPPIAILSVFYGRFVRNLSQQTQEALGETSKHAEEMFSSVRTVQAFTRENYETGQYARKVLEVYMLAKKEV